jgi:prepilin-type N-terminal cleavage/methylation domain-containing protein
MHFQHQSGLTMMELLVVLLIVGMGWFSLLPRLDPTNPSASRNKPLAEVNELLDQAAAAALFQGRFQQLHLERHPDRLGWGEQIVQLPSTVAECRINDNPCPEGEALFRVYAHGLMDRLALALFSGERWASADLAARLVQADSQGRY